MHTLQRIIFIFFLVFLSTVSVFADVPQFTYYPDGSLLAKGNSMTLIGVLSLIQWILLKVVLPIVVVGGSLYIAYELFTADGDETKMKRAWKSVVFTAIGIVCIAVSYAFVSIVSGISL